MRPSLGRAVLAVAAIGCLTLCHAGSAGAQDAAKPATRPVATLEVTAVRDAVDSESIDVDVRLVNRGDGPIRVVDSHMSAMYELDVRDEKGAPVPRTLEGKRQEMESLSTFSTVGVVLAPGESAGNRIVGLNRLFDMSLAGKYSVTVARTVIRPAKIVVRSEPIQVEVVSSDHMAPLKSRAGATRPSAQGD